MTKKVLEIKNVTKVYKIYKNSFDRLKEIFTKKTFHKDFVANDDISFELKEGETLGIIGLNGAGKSTILKIIAGVIEPTSGEITRYGRVTALLELGTGFNPQMNGYDNIHLNAALIGMSKTEIDEKLDEIISFSELGDYIYEPITSYSSGMIMRLAFSIAIFSNPRILIVDEALSVGDAHFSAKCTKALRERKKQDMSIIYVSHDLNSLKLLCDTIILLNHGKVINTGNPEEVINSYNYLISKLNNNQENIDVKSEDSNSFGTLDIEILKASIKDRLGNSDSFSSGEIVTIELHIKSLVDMSNMTIGIVIRDRFGQDIFGTNTFYHKLDIDFEKEHSYICSFEMPLNIGAGQYSISCAVHSEDNHLSVCSHWLDKAASFSITSTKDNFFIGLCRLEPKISFFKVD